MMLDLVLLLADEGTGFELQETVLDLLASLCDAGKCKGGVPSPAFNSLPTLNFKTLKKVLELFLKMRRRL